MSGPAASVFTPSYNKGAYATEAIESVLRQDFSDFEYWILENSTDTVTRETIAPLLTDSRIRYEEITFTAEERAASYVTAVLLNRYYPKANGRYIFYLSDDDLLEPQCLQRCVDFLDEDTSRQVCYFSMRLAAVFEPGIKPYAAQPWITAEHQRGCGTGLGVDCQIDGGQIAHRKDCLDQIGQPYFHEAADAVASRHVDGLFMEKLAQHFVFHPVGEFLGIHRRTPLSYWDKA